MYEEQDEDRSMQMLAYVIVYSAAVLTAMSAVAAVLL